MKNNNLKRQLYAKGVTNEELKELSKNARNEGRFRDRVNRRIKEVKSGFDPCFGLDDQLYHVLWKNNRSLLLSLGLLYHAIFLDKKYVGHIVDSKEIFYWDNDQKLETPVRNTKVDKDLYYFLVKENNKALFRTKVDLFTTRFFFKKFLNE